MTDWLPIAGFDRYNVSDTGVVRGPRKILNPVIDRDGYSRVTLYSTGKKTGPVGVHRLVCLAFHGDPPSPDYHAAHRNGDKSDNRAANVYWATPSENELDKIRHGANPQTAKTHCPQGHEYSEENTYRRPSRPTERQCKACLRVGQLAHQKKNRPMANARNRRYRERKANIK